MLISFFFQKSIIVLKKSIFIRLSNLPCYLAMPRAIMYRAARHEVLGLATSVVGRLYRSLVSAPYRLLMNFSASK